MNEARVLAVLSVVSPQLAFLATLWHTGDIFHGSEALYFAENAMPAAVVCLPVKGLKK